MIRLNIQYHWLTVTIGYGRSLNDFSDYNPRGGKFIRREKRGGGGGGGGVGGSGGKGGKKGGNRPGKAARDAKRKGHK